jgi:protoporphyrinogen IX oxidase
MSQVYLWLKALHVIAVIAWMAGMFYLPRLFVYHCEARPGSERSEVFKIMERRLYRGIMTPAMTASWMLGLGLIYVLGRGAWQGAWWLYGKVALVIAMSALHGFLGHQVRVFASNRNERSAGFFRAVNEVPTVLVIGIVILAVVKPF